MFKSPTLLTALALTAAATLPQIAAAATARLEWKDLDLSSDTGRAELDRRVEVAAKAACTAPPATGSRISKGPNAECLADAKAQIMTKLAARLPQGTSVAAAGGAAQAY